MHRPRAVRDTIPPPFQSVDWSIEFNINTQPQVLFMCTANVLDTIPGPLLDRMEVIR